MPFQVWISQFQAEGSVSSRCTINVNFIEFDLMNRIEIIGEEVLSAMSSKHICED